MGPNNNGAVAIVAFCVCVASVGIIAIAGATWPAAAAIGCLAGMGLGIFYFVTKKY